MTFIHHLKPTVDRLAGTTCEAGTELIKELLVRERLLTFRLLPTLNELAELQQLGIQNDDWCNIAVQINIVD